MTAQATIFLDEHVRLLQKRLLDAGFCAYAVGGCVRDSLLGTVPQDWDICTNARPEDIKACFSDCKTVLTGERYGTVTVLLDGLAFEITTFRAEGGYCDARHPSSVTFLDSLQADLSRRDFTVNAMAADIQGNVIDCFGGLDDLKNGLLRCVGAAHERFSEDALRILRALRFASKLSFSPEAQTAAAIHACAHQLRAVAPERLRKELCGLLCGKNAAAVLRTYADVLCVLMPELSDMIGFRQYNFHHRYDVWEHTLRALDAVPAREELRLAALLHDSGKPSAFTMDKQLVGHFYGHGILSAALTERILHRLRYDGATAQLVTFLVREHDFYLPEGDEKRLRRLLASFGAERLRMLLQLRRADAAATGTVEPALAERAEKNALLLMEQTLEKDCCLTLRQLAVNGSDLLALGIARGPKIGRILNALLDAVIDARVKNTRDALLFHAQNYQKDIDNFSAHG